MDYLVERNSGTEHYFYKDGLHMKKGGIIKETILKEADSAFCVFESDNVVHILCTNRKNELVYILKKGKESKRYVLCELKEGFDVKMMKIAKSKNWLNLLYSAEYSGELLLIHCVLGNHARPSVIDRLASEYFFVYGDRVYYTNKAEVLGYQELTDGKPDRFVPVAEGAYMPYLCRLEEKEYIVYKKEEDIFVNHTLKIKDNYALYPILKLGRVGRLIMWQSGGVLKYAELENEGIQKRIISSRPPMLYSRQAGDNVYYDYDVGENTKENVNDFLEELEKIKKEIKILERKINRLGI